MIKDKIKGHLFFIGLEGPSLNSDEKKWFQTHGAGGVIFFSRNIVDKKQLKDLQLEILSYLPSGQMLPFFCIDMEGGRVAELPDSFKKWPAPKVWAQEKGDKSLFDFGFSMGMYLKELGFHVNFSPCLDTLTQPANQLIGDRALGSKSEEVISRFHYLYKGYQASSIYCTAKHYPGHGHTLVDSHFDLPTDLRTFDELYTQSVLPFKSASEVGIPFFMTAHVMYPSIDPLYPATLSDYFLNNLLRDNLNYQGFCLADDLDMGALTKFGTSLDIAKKFILAGGDLLMYCHRKNPPFDVIEGLRDSLSQQQIKKMNQRACDLELLRASFDLLT